MSIRWIRGSTPAALATLLVLAAGCGRSEPAPVPLPSPVPGERTDEAAEFPQVRFADGQLSINDRCPVRKGRLNPEAHPLYVNGRAVGFC